MGSLKDKANDWSETRRSNNALHLDYFKQTYPSAALVFCAADNTPFDFTEVTEDRIKLSVTCKHGVVVRNVPNHHTRELETCFLRHEGELAGIELAKAKVQAKVQANAEAKAKANQEAKEEKLLKQKLKQIQKQTERELIWKPRPPFQPKQNSVSGIKDTEGKMPIELCFKFLKAMAGRMQKYKSKYPAYNWQKPIDKAQLLEACKRHAFEVFDGNLEDEGEDLGGIEALACDLMMLWYQHKHYPEQKDLYRES